MIKFFLDSGAFSAATLNIKIDIEEYIAFIKRHDVPLYANLDVIFNVEATWENQKIMEAAGLHPLPVFHVNEPIKYLHKCIAEYEYFCLGGMALSPEKERIIFLNKCFDLICDTPDRLPKRKVHGFGMTSYNLIFRYPWYSVDSTSYAMHAGYGQVIAPPRRNGKWVYNEQFHLYRLSVKKSGLNKISILTDYKEEYRKDFLDYITEKGFELGESVMEGDKEIIVKPGLCNDGKLRSELNAIYFVDLAEHIPAWPWPYKHPIHKGFNLE